MTNVTIKETYLCPKCFKEINISTSLTFDESKLKDCPFNFNDIYILYCNCKECNELLFRCDYWIKDHIIKLNKLGFTTTLCCEGHIEFNKTRVEFNYYDSNENYFISAAYICFNKIYPSLENKIKDSKY